jgi:hypothetical protein
MSCKWIVAQKLVLLFFSEVSIIIKIFIYDLSNLKKWNNIYKKTIKYIEGERIKHSRLKETNKTQGSPRQLHPNKTQEKENNKKKKLTKPSNHRNQFL